VEAAGGGKGGRTQKKFTERERESSGEMREETKKGEEGESSAGYYL